MKIIFTQSIPIGERVPINSPREIFLWKNHRNYVPIHSHYGEDNLLVVCIPGRQDGWFLSFSDFRNLLRQGIIKIVLE